MDIQKFIKDRPYLYHLTRKSNADLIIAENKIYSANELIRMSKDKNHRQIQRQKRNDHYEVVIDGSSYFLRDQRPVSEKALSKCLTNGWTVGEFLYHLNDRVFMWPTLDRLWRHFNRYEHEKPVILRFPTRELFDKNSHVLFCRLNSGATRPNSHLGGIAPERGPNTFLTADKFTYAVRDVAEVTFPISCDVSVDFAYGNRPDAQFKSLK